MQIKYDLNLIFFGVCQVILFFALVHGGRPNARYNWIFFIPVFIFSTYTVFFCESDTASPDYAFVQILNIPVAVDYILLRNRQPELRKIGQKKIFSGMTLTERAEWAISLLISPRGIGWAHESTPHLPPRPTTSRGKFIISQILWLMHYSILYDIVLTHSQGNPCFQTGGPSFGAFGWLWQMTVCVHIVTFYCTMSAVYAVLSIISVAARLHEPADWPHIFGSLFDAYTVRNCWGRVWHQLLRRPITSNANAFTSAFHLPKGIFRTYFKLFASLFISALLHAAADYAVHRNFSDGKTFYFVILQAVAITFEDAVIGIASRLGFKQSKAFKLFGFIWVFAWFTFSMPIGLEPLVRAGFVDERKHVGLLQVLIQLTRKTFGMAM